ncbi:MAG TPA: type IV secretory system conjugative DNA transfer family protein [Gemmataceae bacterium]
MNGFENMMDKIFKLFDAYPAIPAAMGVFVVILIIRSRRQRVKQQSYSAPARSGGLLSQILFSWSPLDPVPIRDLLRSIVIFGATGAGKSSGSGLLIAKAVAHCRKIGGLILASKPEDREFWEKVFTKAGRARDLLVFSAASALRFNFIDFILRNNGDTREITKAIMVISETLEQSGGEGRNTDQFWRRQNERMIYNAVEIVRLATGTVTAPDVQRFINGAAQTPATLATPEWRSGFHSRCLGAAHSNQRTSIQQHDYSLAADYWLNEYPVMSEKTRSSILAGVMGILHVFNTGIVRELVSTSTNVSPMAVEHGKWILIDLPISSEGAAGAFILGGWKYLTQWYILKRKATEETPACVIWCDEAQKVMNSVDGAFLAECRSHRGCMVYLTQSIHSFYSRIQGQAGEHETDALLTNFYHKVFHPVGDDKSAGYGSSLVGQRMHMDVDTSGSAPEDMYDALWGQSKTSATTRHSMRKILEHREFMQGMRTGGPENDYKVDGLVVRSGTPFSTGEAFLRVEFDQRG